jgi:alcohol dehydrogenase (cytochrome c)
MPTALLLVLCAVSMFGQVSFDRILRANQEPQNWLTYSGGYNGQRYSTLSQITPANVANLEMKWAFQARSLEKFETTPLVVDGTMYLTQAPNDIFAVDATNGQIKWAYSYSPSRDARPCCGRVNRGVAIVGNTLYMATIDAHLVAVNATDGKLLWDIEVAKAASGYALTHAPLVIKDKVIVGTAGGEYGIRGFIAAYNATTGKEMWKFYTIPGKGEKGNETWEGDSWKIGGASVWVTGTYDAETNLTYWGIGNPGPDWNGDHRAGDNLYASSVVALDADTGQIKWHFQFTPHDVWDYDSTQVPVLADMNWTDKNGRTAPRKVMMFANRNGFVYTLDRTNGQFLMGKPYVKVTWATGLDEVGRPMRAPGMEPTADGNKIYPSVTGGTNWWSPSYSPRTGLLYVSAWDSVPGVMNKLETPFEEGKRFTGGTPTPRPYRQFRDPSRPEEEGTGIVKAIDPKTGTIKWEFKMNDLTGSGILTTATDLLFTGGREGFFQAIDARDGKLLWRVPAGGEIINAPMTYQVNGKQYVVFAAGSSLFGFALK